MHAGEHLLVVVLGGDPNADLLCGRSGLLSAAELDKEALLADVLAAKEAESRHIEGLNLVPVGLAVLGYLGLGTAPENVVASSNLGLYPQPGESLFADGGCRVDDADLIPLVGDLLLVAGLGLALVPTFIRLEYFEFDSIVEIEIFSEQRDVLEAAVARVINDVTLVVTGHSF